MENPPCVTAQKDYAAARPYLEQALASSKKVLGEHHSNTANSLWKVPDNETQKLMSRFFELWLTNRDKRALWPKAEALRQAQLELIAALRKEPDKARPTAPPVLWAGFLCHGQP